MSAERFGKYLLLEKLAAGGMAEVYLSKLTGASGINKFVAVKRILPSFSDKTEFIEMFKEEAKIAVNLSHSNIVTIFEFGIERKQLYLVMEFVEGQNLRQVLNHLAKEQKQLSQDQIIYLVKEVAAGLDHAHRCLDGNTGRPLNITHRDMSPQNIMVSFEGEVKVVDFGIAKAESQMEHTQAGTIKGKFGYMSPEQAEGQVVDPRTDIFSLGIVFWELLANDRLFTAANEAATLKKVRDCQIPSLRKINPQIPAELERICMKALARDRNLRYQTAAAFHKDLNRFLNTQYPDFSTHEFSKFMKSLYHKMYLENRRKLSEYAKVVDVEGPGAAAQQDSEATHTATLTASESAHGLSPSPNHEGAELKIAPSADRVDLSHLRSSQDKGNGFGTRGSGPTMAQTNTSTVIRNHLTQTGSGGRPFPRPPVQSKAKSFDLNHLIFLVAFVFIGAAGYMLMRPNPTPEVVIAQRQGASENPSLAMASINIQTEPPGAAVYINGTPVGRTTPFVGTVAANQQHRLRLQMAGYLPHERTIEVGDQLFTYRWAFQPEPAVGSVTIDVTDQSPSTILTINNVRVDDRGQWVKYPVPAGVPVVIRAMDPFSNAAAEERITLGRGEEKRIVLQLNRAKSNNK